MKSICVMRDIYKAIATYENEFENSFGVCLNEAMALCSIAGCSGKLSSKEIADKTGMTTSHTSKVIRSIETKGLIERTLGEADKRQMYFTLTKAGEKCLNDIHCRDINVPEVLKPIFNQVCVEK